MQLIHILYTAHGSGKFAVFQSAFSHFFSGGNHLGTIQISGFAHALTEISGTEKDNINSRHGAYLLNLVHGFNVLDLNKDKTVFIDKLYILRKGQQTELTVRIASVNGTASHRIKFGLPGDVSGVFGTHYMGNHNTGGVQLKRFYKFAVTASRHTYHKVDTGTFGRQNLPLHQIGISRYMFLTDPGTIKPGQPGNFNDP